MAETYISKVKLPGDTTVYTIKDSWARDEIGKLSNATHFLGRTSTALSDGASTATITVGTDTYAVSPTESQKQLNNGDIVVASGDAGDTSDEGTEYICAIPGEGTAAITWYKFGSAKLNELGNLAYKNSASGSYTPSVTGDKGTLSVDSKTIAAVDRPLVLSTTAITDATSFKAVNAITHAKTNVTVSGTPAIIPTNITTSVDGTATLSGTFTGVTGVTGGTGIANTSTSLALYAVTGGQKIITDVTINKSGTGLVEGVTVSSVTGGAATVGSATVYGLAAATTKYMTGPESLDKKNITVLSAVSASTTVSAINASVTVIDEVLTFTSVTPLNTITFNTAAVLSSTTGITGGTSATASTYTVGKSGATSFTNPTVTLSVDACGLTVTSNTYKVSVPANTWIKSVTAASATTGTINVTVSGDITADGDVTVGSWGTSTITLNGTTDASIVTSLTTSTYYGKVNIPAHTHSHTLSGNITVAPKAKTVTVS